MGDEVTKKDLQSLMGTFNAKISDLDKKLGKEVTRLDAMDADDNKITVQVKKDLSKDIADLWAAVKQLQGEVGKLANQVDKFGG